MNIVTEIVSLIHVHPEAHQKVEISSLIERAKPINYY